jgi:primosomal protein N' (replication factor Y)
MPEIAQVEPLTTARALRGPFDYRLPTALREDVTVGSMLVVPFGRRQVLGVVVGLAEHSELGPQRLLAPLRALEQGVPSELVALAAWIAREHCSTPARALQLVLPPGVARGRGPLKRLVAELTPAGRALLEGGQGPAAPPNGRRPRPLTPRQREILAGLRDGPRPVGAAETSRDSLRRLAARGLLAIERRPVPRRAVRPSPHAPRSAPPKLTPAQAGVLERLEQALHEDDPQRRLLQGVTGSGKTEIYLRLAAAALERGRGAIVLVPEIALTPQISRRFAGRFGETVAVLHSRLSAGERHDEWLRLRSGQARLCVGPRSAIFAPIDGLGLIVVDEEHDASYKHEGDPRYDARRVAEWRARHSRALLLLGSATPRPESALRVPSLRLASRADGRPLPPVEVLDMRGQPHGLHPCTTEALLDTRARGGKAIVLLNRRGWSNFLSCRACGLVWSCPDCDVALVLHRAEGLLACHHCGHREPTPARCGACGSASVARHGAGTERLEHDLARVLDDRGFPVFRLDADTVARSPTGPASVLDRFERASRGVLVGTQMVAKGHDFPGVGLGVVLDADATLRFPDFRAEERTFALIAQLAGRVGRGGPGQVLVQTLAPQARSIVHAARHDSGGFLAGELERRRELRYPPFSELIRIVCASERAAAARRAALALRERLRLSPEGSAERAAGVVLGPAPLFRLRGRERQMLLVKAAERGPAVRAVERALELTVGTAVGAGVSFSVDVDPQ